ncbi:hypothetical protein OTU49_010184 [Cherax quadricarinatus]|uniref:Uncharacterized protein n=1 Tax=Cherax quadricarinatus TaxID=27406 RepID=A0AAW0WF41_CHEQU
MPEVDELYRKPDDTTKKDSKHDTKKHDDPTKPDFIMRIRNPNFITNPIKNDGTLRERGNDFEMHIKPEATKHERRPETGKNERRPEADQQERRPEAAQHERSLPAAQNEDPDFYLEISNIRCHGIKQNYEHKLLIEAEVSHQLFPDNKMINLDINFGEQKPSVENIEDILMTLANTLRNTIINTRDKWDDANFEERLFSSLVSQLFPEDPVY